MAASDCILIVAAHPDDEVLGCGGAISRHAVEGHSVHILFVAEGITARAPTANSVPHRAEFEARMESARKAAAILGAREPQFLDFPDNRCDQIALLDIIKAIETTIRNVKPSIIYTHHRGDLNIDHACVHRAVVTACRPIPGQSVKALYAFETLSSTEWAFSPQDMFVPQHFVEIGSTLDRKLEALACYTQEMRLFPHTRSFEAVRAQALLRGASVGVEAAEAFQVVRQSW